MKEKNGHNINNAYTPNYQATALMRRKSVFGIATRYGLDGLGIKSRWGRDFPHPSRPVVGSTQLPIQWVPGIPGSEAAGAWR
jgi:hypothetical protein